MRFKLRVHFIDLIAFVSEGSSIIAVTPNEPACHEPGLIFDDSSLRTGEGGDRGDQFGTSTRLRYWPLVEEDLVVQNPHPEAPGHVDLGPDINSDTLPTGHSKRFKWVTSMEELLPGVGSIAPGVKTGRTNLVGSRFRFDTGQFRTLHFCAHPRNPRRHIHTYRFKKGSDVSVIPERAIVNMATADIALQGPDATIESRKFGDPGVKRKLPLKATGGRSFIDVVYTNYAKHPPHGIEHFDYFYDLMVGWPASKRFLPERKPGRKTPDGLINARYPEIVRSMRSAKVDLLVDPEACPQVRCE